MKKKSKGINKKEKLFCLHYVNSLNAELAAKCAGYKNPIIKGEQLLGKKEIEREINSIVKSREKIIPNIAGLIYQRLAFGSITDAVSLLYMDNPKKEELEKMDLFMVQEIKKPKDGAMEIKFFDRFKALTGLSSSLDDESKNAGGLVQALYLGAEKLNEEGNDFGV